VLKRISVNADKAVFGPDGNTLVIGSTDGLLRWWSLDEDEEQFSVSVGQYVDDVASSADHKRFVTAGDDVASTWDFARRRQLRQMPYPMFFRAVAMSADRRLMASVGSDFSRFILEVSEVHPDNPLETACRKVKRNLTRIEWGTYFGMAEPYELTCPQIPAADANKN
jgi:WD40 repeat protein